MGDQNFRAASGEWLARSEIQQPKSVKNPRWPGAVVEVKYGADPRGLEVIEQANPLQFEYDLMQGSPAELLEFLQELVPSSIACGIFEAVQKPPQPARDHSNRTPITGGGDSATWFDFPVATATDKKGWCYTVRICWVFIMATKLVVVWGDWSAYGNTEELEDVRDDIFRLVPYRWNADLSIGRTLPVSRDPLLAGQATSGGDLLTRFLERVIRHELWALLMTQDGLVAWDARFLTRYRELSDIREQIDELAKIGQAVSCAEFGLRALLRRIETQDVFVEPARSNLMTMVESARTNGRTARAEVREAFLLASQAVNAAEATIVEERARQTRHFEYAAGVVTAFVLVPGLVVGIYGANVEGLPGQNNVTGLLYLGAAVFLSGLITIILLVAFIRRLSTASKDEGPSKMR